MKKLLVSIIILISILAASIACVKAESSDKLIDYASKTFTINGKEKKLPTQYLNSLKSYVKEYPVSDADADKIIAKSNEAIAVVNKEGVSDISKLSQAKKDEVKAIAEDIASIAGVTINYDYTDKTLSIYKNGKMYCDPIYLGESKFVQTGNGTMTYVIPAAVALIAVATIFGARKLKANEN